VEVRILVNGHKNSENHITPRSPVCLNVREAIESWSLKLRAISAASPVGTRFASEGKKLKVVDAEVLRGGCPAMLCPLLEARDERRDLGTAIGVGACADGEVLSTDASPSEPDVDIISARAALLPTLARKLWTRLPGACSTDPLSSHAAGTTAGDEVSMWWEMLSGDPGTVSRT
jgi:hypothetical protein